MTSPDENAWNSDAKRLRGWFVAYLLLWGSGIYMGIAGYDFGEYLFFSCVVPYVLCIVFAYRVQKKLNTAGVYKAGAWQVIVGAILLNPFALGFVIPASVLWRCWRIKYQVPLSS